MLTVLRHTTCPSCGHRHNFCLTAGHLIPGREYGYLCPETSAPATIRPTDGGDEARYYPQGAVQLAVPGVVPAVA